MKKVSIVVSVPLVVNDYLLEIARLSRRNGEGPRSKEEVINKIVKDYYLQQITNK